MLGFIKVNLLKAILLYPRRPAPSGAFSILSPLPENGVVNIGYTAHIASVQPACDVSNCEHSLTLGKPFYATLSPVRINNRKQQQSLAQVRMSQKRLMSQKVLFSVTKTTQKLPSPLSSLPAESPASKQIQGFRAIY